MSFKKLVYWDIDGTLLHCGSDGRKALNRTFLEKYGIEDAFGSARIGGAMDSMILDGIMESHGIDKEELPEIIDHYKDVLADVLSKNEIKCVLPGVMEIVERIHDSDCLENALLTSNLEIGARTKLKSLGLNEYFDMGGFGDEPGEKWDIARKSIARAEKLFNTSFTRDRLFIIGDSTYDLITAKKVGMVSIAVGTGWSTKEELLAQNPDYYFDDLGDVEKIVSILFNGCII